MMEIVYTSSIIENERQKAKFVSTVITGGMKEEVNVFKLRVSPYISIKVWREQTEINEIHTCLLGGTKQREKPSQINFANCVHKG